jgi:glycosyltransferase involved in cell wall biosynthesis
LSPDPNDDGGIDISLVIPAYNEAALLPRLLETVRVARDRYSDGPDRIEVIVADNGSTDGTGDIARDWGCRVASVEKRLIATARNGGAAIARGALVCFTDADGQIHPETFNAIKRAMHTGRYVAGATGATMERWSPGIATAYAIMLPMMWVLGIDTGVVFCRRDDFVRVGGYNEDHPYTEDVWFLMDLKRIGRKRGQRLIRLRRAKTTVSCRKFDTHGDWHFARMMLASPFLALFARARLERFVQEYWYGER